jgi:hypothetical protein
MYTCNQCFCTFKQKVQFHGHLAHCNSSNLIDYDALKHLFESFESDHSLPMESPMECAEDDHFSEPKDILNPVNYRYHQFQDYIEKIFKMGNNRMAKVKTSSGEFVEGARNIYIKLMIFSSSRQQLSENDNTDLITMIKEISRINGLEVPLPSR